MIKYESHIDLIIIIIDLIIIIIIIKYMYMESHRHNSFWFSQGVDLVHWLFFITFAVSIQVILELILHNIPVGSASNDKQFLSGCIQGYGWLILFRFSGKFLNMLNGQPSQSQTFTSKGKNIIAINIRALLHKIFVSQFIINTISDKHENTCNT